MKLLLDTHVFLWWDNDPGQLSAAALAAISDPANEAWLSVARVWEIVIKVQLGKLTTRLALPDVISEQQANGLKILPATLPHILAVAGLPPAHKDPFDRLLAAQAIHEGMELVTADPVFMGYPVRILW